MACSSLIGLDEFKPRFDPGAGGAAGSGGSAGAAGSAAVGGSSGGVVHDGGVGGVVSGGAGGTGGSDNCPDDLRIDCSGECYDAVSACQGACDPDSGIEALIAVSSLPARVRLPGAQSDSACCSPVVRALRIEYSGPGANVRYSVEFPWRIAGLTETEVVDGRVCMRAQTECSVRSLSNRTVFVYTDDEQAPVTDLLMEEGESCP